MSFQDIFGTELPETAVRSVKKRIGHIIQVCIDSPSLTHVGIENYHLKAAALGVRDLLRKGGYTTEQAHAAITIDKLRAYLVLKLTEKPHVRKQVSAILLDHYGIRMPPTDS